MFLWLKQMFDAKLLIKRLPSFSVPKITVIQHVKPILKLSKLGKHEQSYEKTLVPLKYHFALLIVSRGIKGGSTPVNFL